MFNFGGLATYNSCNPHATQFPFFGVLKHPRKLPENMHASGIIFVGSKLQSVIDNIEMDNSLLSFSGYMLQKNAEFTSTGKCFEEKKQRS